jgi:hypothetical protein
VEIDGRAGPLPDMLDGVLPVPHPECPTVIMQSAGDEIDWPELARAARGIALALGRAWLLTEFRMVFLAITAERPQIANQLTRPDDEAIAKAFGQPVASIREIQRSLRAGNRKIMDWLIPIVSVQLGANVANHLLDREHALVEDDEIAGAIVAAGGSVDLARDLITSCREAESLDELRRSLGLPLAEYNAACAELGTRFPPLRFDRLLRRLFEDRVEELRPALAERVRDAFATQPLKAIRLADYREALKLDWITFDEGWIDTHDGLDDATVDAHIDALAATALPIARSTPGGSLDGLRQRNRLTLSASVEELKRVASAWVSKATGRALPGIWNSKPEAIIREALNSGVFDFSTVEAASLPEALQVAGLWPVGMPPSVNLSDLGLVPADLDQQKKAEQQRREEDERQSRSVRFGGVDVVGGTSGSLQAVADALQAGLSSKAFQNRSGPAVLRPFPEGDGRQPRKPGRGKLGRDPSFLTDLQRDLIGFAGEYAAYVHLKRTVRNFADEHWVSSLGRRYLCLPVIQDGGYDFHVPRARGGLYYEVKAHTGDPGHIDLERSQVEAAVQFADERSGVWRILYISNVLDPDLITVHELANPFSEGNMRLYRPSNRQGVRLLIDRE